jgi:hypothetical protein
MGGVPAAAKGVTDRQKAGESRASRRLCVESGIEFAVILAVLERRPVMPIPLVKVPYKALATARVPHWTIDWIGIWALILGAIAAGLAAFVYVADDNPVAAAFVLIAVASIIGVVAREGAPARDPD